MRQDTVSGVLENDAQAAAVLTELEAAGFEDTDILVLLPSKGVVRGPEHARVLPEGLAHLSPTGATLGGLLGLLVGVTAVAIAWIGPLLVELPLIATAIATTVLGAAAGAHAGTGVSRIVADARERRRKDVTLLLAVYTEGPGQVDAARRILETHAASEVVVEPAARVH
jgi:hypothetical protein